MCRFRIWDSVMNTFKEYSKEYLEDIQFTHAPTTIRSTTSRVNNLNRAFGSKKIKNIKKADIRRWLKTQHKIWSNKTINEHLTVLREVFSAAIENDVIQRNPMLNIENLKTTLTECHPFTKDEISKIFHYDPLCFIGRALVATGTQTGLRISELLAVDWDSVDFTNKKLQVKRAVFKGNYRVPKTPGSVRNVELNEHALSILKSLYQRTGKLKPRTIDVLQIDNKTKRKESVSFVFFNSKTNRPFSDGSQFAKSFLTPALRILDIPHRGPGQLRHTYASQALTQGLNANYVARQMGHKSVETMRKHYAKWVQEDASDNAAVLSRGFDDVFGSGNENSSTEEIAINSNKESNLHSGSIDAEDMAKMLEVLSMCKKKPALTALVNSMLTGDS